VAGLCSALAGATACAPPSPGEVAVDAAPVSDAAGVPIGARAVLSTHAHGVMGTAVVIDARTIELRDFWFDGDGLDVRIYGGLAGDYAGGVALSADLRRAEPYLGETLTLTLPLGVSLADLDGISVWCVPAGASFGDGPFVPAP
jgi:hypothetical protein